MFLKSLSVSGFKSFAERTVLDFEPGITVIVGPNGSGKSNVVDALAWVLGTRSAKLLRGGELTDVIFAGSPARPPAGRARVEITIDNDAAETVEGRGSTEALAAMGEVRISREILRTGETVYAINGEPCRLLDIEELLSDRGLGRELHTVVGQGQLDAILQAKPEERRAFVEEAAGILKHRRRRERAERKLEQVDLHLERLSTVLRELRRQLRPLERQAEAATKRARLEERLREVRLRLAASELVRLRAEADARASSDEAVTTRLEDAEAEAAEVTRRVEAGEARLADQATVLAAARETVERLARLGERLAGTAGLVTERRRHLIEFVEEPLAGRPPAELRAQAERLDAELAERIEKRAVATERLEEAVNASRDALITRRELERRAAEAERRRAEARERRARHAGELEVRRSAVAAATEAESRFAKRLEELDAELRTARDAVEAIQEQIRDLDAEEWTLQERLEAAETAADEAADALEAALEAERVAERARASELTRAEALRDMSADPRGSANLLDRSEDGGIVGALADAIRVEAGAEAAVAAALGPLGDAVLATSRAAASRAIARLRVERSGRATLLPAGPPPIEDPDDDRLVPLAGLVSTRGKQADAARATLHRVLARTYLVETWEEAVALHEQRPDATFVTRDGDLAGPRGFVGGSAPEGSMVLRTVAAERAEQRAEELAGELEETSRAVERARDALAARRAELDAAAAAMHESDARITGAAEELHRANRLLEDLSRERERVRLQLDESRASIAAGRRALEELSGRTPAGFDGQDASASGDEEQASAPREAEIVVAEEAIEAARREEMDARLAVERLDEQIRHVTGTIEGLRREADEVEDALAAAARRRELRRTHIQECGELAIIVEEAQAALARSVTTAETQRDRLEAERAAEKEELARLRSRLRELTNDLEEVREERHAADLARAELRRDLDDQATRLRETFDLEPDEVAAMHPQAASFDHEALSAEVDDLVRRIGLIGAVNPLALEEFSALEERHAFLKRQMEDLRSSRRDLRDVIVAVDERIREVFAAAYEDVSLAFSEVFATVFPGGEGRLRLTEPDDLLVTGIEVEARPPGKRIRRLSLLSGGERSLTALAFLFAIFRARPSPFYVLDEVEAALDDVNLRRLLRVIETFKEHAQLLVVTHQKPTMEIADVLYGVTMNDQAVSKVVSERVREPAAS